MLPSPTSRPHHAGFSATGSQTIVLAFKVFKQHNQLDLRCKPLATRPSFDPQLSTVRHSMFTITMIGISLLLLLLLYRYLVVPMLFTPLSKIPNAHFSAPISSLWISSKRRAGTGVRAVYSLHQQKGPIVRLSPGELSVCTPAALRTIYIGGFEKHRWYLDAFANYGTLNMVSMIEHKPHSVQKRMVSNLYSKSFLQNNQDLLRISHHLIFDRFLPIVDSVAKNDAETNIFDFTQAVGMDFTSSYLFGLSNGTNFMHDIEYRHYWLAQYKAFKVQLPQERADCEVERWCFSMCEAAEAFLRSDKAQNGSMATQPVVYERLSQSLEGSSRSKPDPRSLMVQTASEMLDHLIAGHETSGITLTYLTHELSQRSDLQSRLRNELLTLNPQIAYPPLGDENKNLPSARSIDALPLLDSILQETLRLYAAAPAQQPRMTPYTPQGTTLEGYENIPGGIRVSANAYTLHRNATVFPEPLKWIPERWMDAKDGCKEEMKRWFWAFSSGGRMCLGSNFAIQGISLNIMLLTSSSY